MLFEIVNLYYEGKMLCPFEENTFVKCASEIFKNTDQPVILYEVAEYLFLQCANSVNSSKLVQSYLDFIKVVLMQSHECHLIVENKIS